ncbi:hypothetical protein ACFQX7_02185 [Luedemannella flava]
MGVSDQQVFLRSNAIIEPLVDRFYAWLHITAPVQASMNLANLQVPLLESYLQNPQVHVAASVNPALRGGYFVNIEEARSHEVAELLDSIKRDRADMLAFAAAIAEAEKLLRENATGFDLTPLYPKLPEALNGLVELAYDTSNQASMHFLEPLAYTSPIYDVSRQSVQLSLETGIERPFILSTPRLPQPDVLDLQIPSTTRVSKSCSRPASRPPRSAGCARRSSSTTRSPRNCSGCSPTSPASRPTGTSRPAAGCATSATRAWSCRRPRRRC